MDISTEAIQQVVTLLREAMDREPKAEEQRSGYDLEVSVRQVLQLVGVRLLKELVENEEERYPSTEVACRCGGKAQYLFRRKAQTLSTLGWVEYRRAYYVCPECHRGQHPLDQRLGLRPGRVSVAMAELLAMEGIEVSFEEAQHKVAKMLLVEVSENTVRNVTQELGALRAEAEGLWIQKSREGYDVLERRRLRDKPPDRLYGAVDGVIIPVDDEWRELKCGCWYSVEKRAESSAQVGETGDLQATQIEYYCDICDVQHFRDLAWATGYQRQADRAREVVFVADGASWIWKLVTEEFPGATQIVDWYHAAEYLSGIAQSAFREEGPKEAWLARTREQLWQGEIDAVIASCREQEGQPGAATAVQKAITYFSNNRERMDYKRFREQGYQIGSGTVESACKQIGTQRLKRPGARWSAEGARLTAKARATWLSNQWDALVAQALSAAQAA